MEFRTAKFFLPNCFKISSKAWCLSSQKYSWSILHSCLSLRLPLTKLLQHFFLLYAWGVACQGWGSGVGKILPRCCTAAISWGTRSVDFQFHDDLERRREFVLFPWCWGIYFMSGDRIYITRISHMSITRPSSHWSHNYTIRKGFERLGTGYIVVEYITMANKCCMPLKSRI